MTGTRRATPTAYRVLPADAPREQWLATRRQGLGSSDVAAVLGVDERKSALHVYYDKIGQLPEEDAGEAAMWGNILEEPVAREWCRRNKTSSTRVGVVVRLNEPWMLCTLDRLVDRCPLLTPPIDRSSQRCALEVKTRNAWVAGKWRGGVPDDVHAQVAWQMAVTGYDHVHIAVLIGGQEFRQFTVRRDPGLEETIVERAALFWHANVQFLLPPPSDEVDPDQVIGLENSLYPDRTGSIEVNVLETWERVTSYQLAGIREKEAKNEKAKAKAWLIGQLHGAEVATVDGEKVYDYTPTTRSNVDLERLRERWPEAYDECVTESSSPTFRLSPKYTWKR